MKYELGTVVITVSVDVHEDEDGELTIDGGSVPTLGVSVDLPGSDPIATAAGYCRKVADQLEEAA